MVSADRYHFKATKGPSHDCLSPPKRNPQSTCQQVKHLPARCKHVVQPRSVVPLAPECPSPFPYIADKTTTSSNTAACRAVCMSLSRMSRAATVDSRRLTWRAVMALAIRFLWMESELSLYFTVVEVVELIGLSFVDNARTREVVREIEANPRPR